MDDRADNRRDTDDGSDDGVSATSSAYDHNNGKETASTSAPADDADDRSPPSSQAATLSAWARSAADGHARELPAAVAAFCVMHNIDLDASDLPRLGRTILNKLALLAAEGVR
jgi:hypothetical protein